MRHYTKILRWENAKRLSKLMEFRKLIIEYFNNHRNTNVADVARSKINRYMNEVHSIVVQSGINPIYTWRAPPIAGGYSAKIDLIINIFNLDDYFTEYDLVLDLIDRSIGIYESNTKWARFRIFNPFFYIGLGLDFISDLPFIALGKLGFNRQKARTSAVGRLVKGVLFLIPIFAAFLTTLHHLGYLDPVKQFVHEFLGTKKAN